MTTATETTIRVPVRTWREKAILAATIARGMPDVEGIETGLMFVEDLLLSGPSTDDALDNHFTAWAHVEKLQGALRELRSIEPAPNAWLEVPPGVDIQSDLGQEISYMVETDIDELNCEHPSKRDWAEALVVAIDLRDELAGGDA